jgi:hypothetical protein
MSDDPGSARGQCSPELGYVLFSLSFPRISITLAWPG